jgi:hypothetical protein
MVISNIGTIVAALPSSTSAEVISDASSAMLNTPRQVRLISIANTLTRILVGPLADYVSPVASYLPNGTVVRARKHRISRVFFPCLSAIILVLTFLWTSFGITTQSGLFILRCVLTILHCERRCSTSLQHWNGHRLQCHFYCDVSAFTIMSLLLNLTAYRSPSIVSSMWGLKHLGRNFGFLMYAPFTGTPLFSYIYAFVSQSHSTSGEICRGAECWRATFRLTSVTSFLAVLVALVLWKEWRERL